MDNQTLMSVCIPSFLTFLLWIYLFDRFARLDKKMAAQDAKLNSVQVHLDKRLAELQKQMDAGLNALHKARLEEMNDIMRTMTNVHTHLRVLEAK